MPRVGGLDGVLQSFKCSLSTCYASGTVLGTGMRNSAPLLVGVTFW